MSRTKNPRTKTTNLNEKYNEFLSTKGNPKDNASNPLNLFDESNIEDRAWVKLAKVYISRKKKEVART